MLNKVKQISSIKEVTIESRVMVERVFLFFFGCLRGNGTCANVKTCESLYLKLDGSYSERASNFQ